MGFQTPVVLIGLAAVGIPVAIHLIQKMRVRHVKWAAMRFLRDAVQKNERKLRVEDLLLLIARCLLTALLVLAFSRPVLNPEGDGSGFGGGTKVAVLVLDESASMGYSEGIGTRLELAKDAVVKYLDALASGSSVALIEANSRNAGATASPGSDFSAIRKALEVAVPSGGANDWSTILSKAFETLKPYQGVEREIVIFTDNQATAWQHRETLKLLVEANPGVSLRLIPVGGMDAQNMAVVSLRAEAGVPSANKPMRFRIEVHNFGAEPVENIRLAVAVDSLPPSVEQLLPRIEAGQSQIATIELTLPSAGYHTITASIPPDRLPADNARSMPLLVASETYITIIEEQVGGREAFFLGNAFMPMAREKAGDAFLKIRTAPAKWLEEARMERESAIVLADPRNISETVAKQIREYVEKGGCLFVFPGNSTSPEALNASLEGVLPATLAESKDASPEPMRWSAGPHGHPVTAFWNGKPESSLDSVITTKHFPLRLRGDEARPVVNFSDGSPAVVEGSFGLGRVVLFGVPPDPKWTNLPLNPNFVPFIQSLLSHFITTRSEAGGIVDAGVPFQTRVGANAAGRPLLISSPDARDRKPAGYVARTENGGLVVWRDTLRPGAYRLFLDGSDIALAAFAVQVPALESDLEPYQGAPLDFASQGLETRHQTAPVPKGVRRELWWALLLMALVVAIFEMGMAHRFSTSK